MDEGYFRRNYSAVAAATAAAEADEEDEEEDEEEEAEDLEKEEECEEEGRGSEVEEGDKEREGMRRLAKEIERFGEVYERVEAQKLIWKCRIWGEQGQAALEKSSICLLNCGPTGSETLKNLVLGGVGSITVVDGSKVEAGDLGNNVLVDEASLGKSKAKCVCSFLQELNDAVKAKFVEECPETLIETNPSFFSQFTLVVATQGFLKAGMVAQDEDNYKEAIDSAFKVFAPQGIKRQKTSQKANPKQIPC